MSPSFDALSDHDYHDGEEDEDLDIDFSGQNHTVYMLYGCN